MDIDLIDRLSDLANRLERQQDSVSTEEATKTAFVLPFLQALGYDVFNPREVIPEFTADHGVKKGEKVDYAISLDSQIMMLIERESSPTPFPLSLVRRLSLFPSRAIVRPPERCRAVRIHGGDIDWMIRRDAGAS